MAQKPKKINAYAIICSSLPRTITWLILSTRSCSRPLTFTWQKPGVSVSVISKNDPLVGDAFCPPGMCTPKQSPYINIVSVSANPWPHPDSSPRPSALLPVTNSFHSRSRYAFPDSRASMVAEFRLETSSVRCAVASFGYIASKTLCPVYCKTDGNCYELHLWHDTIYIYTQIGLHTHKKNFTFHWSMFLIIESNLQQLGNDSCDGLALEMVTSYYLNQRWFRSLAPVCLNSEFQSVSFHFR